MNPLSPALKKNLLLAAAAIAIALLAWGVWTMTRPKGLGEGFVSGNGRIEATEIDVATKYAVRQILVGARVDAIEPGADHGYGGRRVRVGRIQQRPLVRRRIHPQSQTGDDGQPRRAQHARKLARMLGALGRGVATT